MPARTLKDRLEQNRRGREKPVVLAGRFTKAEEQCVQRVALAQGVGVADYVRTAVLFTMVMDGDLGAMKLVAGDVRRRMAERFKRELGIFDIEGARSVSS